MYLQAHQEEKTSGDRWEALQASLHPCIPIQGRAGLEKSTDLQAGQAGGVGRAAATLNCTVSIRGKPTLLGRGGEKMNTRLCRWPHGGHPAPQSARALLHWAFKKPSPHPVDVRVAALRLI